MLNHEYQKTNQNKYSWGTMMKLWESHEIKENRQSGVQNSACGLPSKYPAQIDKIFYYLILFNLESPVPDFTQQFQKRMRSPIVSKTGNPIYADCWRNDSNIAQNLHLTNRKTSINLSLFGNFLGTSL